MELLWFLLNTTILSADTTDSDCAVIPITQWAGESSHRHEDLTNPVDIAIIQHTVTAECNTDSDCVKTLKNIRNSHIEFRGFDDIGQSFLIGGNGKVYEGAGWHHVGAHTRGYNAKSVGVSFVGDFREKLPTPAALKAAQDLLTCGVRNKHLRENYHLVGQSQLSATLSPGAALQAQIQTWPHWTDKISF